MKEKKENVIGIKKKNWTKSKKTEREERKGKGMGKKEIKKDEIKREEIKRNEIKREERNREQIMGNETDKRKRKGKEINRDKSIQKKARMRHWAAVLAVLFCLAFVWRRLPLLVPGRVRLPWDAGSRLPDYRAG